MHLKLQTKQTEKKGERYLKIGLEKMAEERYTDAVYYLSKASETGSQDACSALQILIELEQEL